MKHSTAGVCCAPIHNQGKCTCNCKHKVTIVTIITIAVFPLRDVNIKDDVHNTEHTNCILLVWLIGDAVNGHGMVN
jgi:hypothetical protein